MKWLSSSVNQRPKNAASSGLVRNARRKPSATADPEVSPSVTVCIICRCRAVKSSGCASDQSQSSTKYCSRRDAVRYGKNRLEGNSSRASRSLGR